MIREIIVAAREGGETNNARLQLAIRNAKKEDVPNDRIDAAIQRAAGGQGENYEEHLYEAYAPHGVALAIGIPPPPQVGVQSRPPILH